MKNIINDLVNSFRVAKMKRKILIVIIGCLYLFIMLAVTIKVNYEIYTPGLINTTVATNVDVQDYAVISFENDNVAGKIHTVGIYTHKRISFYQYVLAKLSNEIDEYTYNPKTDASAQEDYKSGVIQKDYSITDALIVAYEAAHAVDPSIEIIYDFEGLIVVTISKKFQSDLQIGDVITEINGQSFTSLQDFEAKVIPLPANENINLKIKRGEEELVVQTQKRLNTKNQYILPFYYHEKISIDQDRTTPKFTISEDLHSTGSSGGAMMALAIYNALTEGDITKGKFIIGTGTIDLAGNVGPIGGIRQKIATACMYDVDIFFVGSADYDEAKAMYEEIKQRFKGGFQLIKVNNFQEILEELERLP